jgi:hypothetical protein
MLFDLPEEKEAVDELCIRVMDEDRGGRQVDFEGSYHYDRKARHTRCFSCRGCGTSEHQKSVLYTDMRAQ